ncbi:hypothetical protein ZWY2020_038156 [Hordeum vulgare]|nr:hypothetical protein ZWY2020_038156 [Hordeum vulgare]
MEFEEESNDDNSQDYSQMLCENSEDDEKYKIPDSIEDEDYRGLELDLMVFYRKHGKATKRFVAFEGTSTGRRFLACAEQAQETRTKEHLYVVSEYKKEFEEQKAEIARKEGENQKLNEKYVILENLSRAQGKMIKNVKCNHLKEKERLIEERREMKLQISQLQEVLANSEAEITDEVTKLKNELACMSLSNEKLTAEVATSSSWNQLLNEKTK